MPEDLHFTIELMNCTGESARKRLNRTLMRSNAALYRAKEAREAASKIQTVSISYRDDDVPYAHLQENL